VASTEFGLSFTPTPTPKHPRQDASTRQLGFDTRGSMRAQEPPHASSP
jgi:hypothetical protein